MDNTETAYLLGYIIYYIGTNTFFVDSYYFYLIRLVGITSEFELILH